MPSFGVKRSKKSKKAKKGEEAQTISLKEGWDKIGEIGVKPFFARVEKIDSMDLDTTSVPKTQYITTYDTIFTMCIQREPYNYSSPLYSKHSEALTQHFKDVFMPQLSLAKADHGLKFLKEWKRRWRIGKWCVDGMTRMFMYLDRFHVPNSEDLLSTSEQGYTLFREHVFKPFKTTAREAVLDCIRRERDGEEQDRDLLRDCIAVFVELGSKQKKVDLQIYKVDFHEELIRQTEEYYKVRSRSWMDAMSCPEYMVKAEECVISEENRLGSYVDKSSTEGLMRAARNELLKEHQEELLAKETGIARLLERTDGADMEAAKEDLSRLYRLYSEVTDGLTNVSEAMKSYICCLGNGFIQKSKENQREDTGHTLIRNLIDLHDRYLRIVKDNFKQDPLFHKALKDAFEEFINKEYYTSNLLARFANDILKKGTKVMAGDLDMTMDHVVMIYGYIRDKDIFEKDYQQFLASRLLQDLSQSEQAERSMIGKLKNEAGYHWTSKLEDMFKDIQRSKELMVEFNKAFGRMFGVELSVSVCTTGSWPSNSILPVTKPPEIGPVADKFQSFYLAKYSGRRLSYQWEKGKADVRVAFNPKCTKILTVSTYQMLILLAFNRGKTLTFGDILKATNIPRTDCIIHLLSMVHPKVKVLRKNPNTKEIEDAHKLQINPKYANPRAKVPVPVLVSVSPTTAKDKDKDMDAINLLRRHQMDAAIVRIMKARKTLKHHDLVSEVVKQLHKRFTPKPVDIKKRIANLIELEYLERDASDRQTYHYRQ